MALNTRSYVTTWLSQRSKNVVSGLVDLSKINTALVDNLNFSVKNKWVTTKQTIEAIAATIEGWLSTRVHCDKETYKNMYQDILKQWTILKHKIESIISNMNTMKKKPHELQNVVGNFYNWLQRLLLQWERKVNESSVYPDEKIWFDTQDWNDEIKDLMEKKDMMTWMSHKVEDILYMNQIA